jgi:hypothetical protein
MVSFETSQERPSIKLSAPSVWRSRSAISDWSLCARPRRNQYDFSARKTSAETQCATTMRAAGSCREIISRKFSVTLLGHCTCSDAGQSVKVWK